MNKPVSPKIAKLLGEKGVDKISSDVFYTDNYGLCKLGNDGETLIVFNHPKTNQLEVIFDVNGEFEEGLRYAAPTIAEVIMWLYEKHGIWIQVYIMEKSNDWSNYFDYSIKHKKIGLIDIFNKLKEFNSPTEGYEEAIEYTLNKLI